MYCSRCGRQLLKNTKFCGRCGNPQESQLDRRDQFEGWSTYSGDIQRFPQGEDGKGKNKRKGAALAVILVLVALILAGSWMFLRPSPQMTFSDAMERGNYYLVELNFEQAEVYFRRAMEIEPRQVQPYIELAYIYYEHFEDVDQALEILEQGMHQVAEEDLPDLIAIWEKITTLPPPISIHGDEGDDEAGDDGDDEAGDDDDDEAGDEGDDEAEVIPEFEIRWVLEPSIEADDINYVEITALFGYTNDGKRHFQSPFAVISRGNHLGIIDNNGNIIGDVTYDGVTALFNDFGDTHGREGTNDGIYQLSLRESVEMELNGEMHDIFKFFLENDEIVPIRFTGGPGVATITYYYSGGLQKITSGREGYPYNQSAIFNIPLPVRELELFDPETSEWWEWRWYLEQVGLYGVLYRGEIRTEFIYTNMGSYSDGLLAVELDGYWGYINKHGEVIIPIEYDASWSFQGWTGSVDEEVRPFAFAASDGFVPLVKDGIWELRNVNGELVIPPGIFDAIRPVYDGRSWVKKDGLWGIIQVVAE